MVFLAHFCIKERSMDSNNLTEKRAYYFSFYFYGEVCPSLKEK